MSIENLNFNLKGHAILELKEYNANGQLETVFTKVENNIVLKSMYYSIMTANPGGFTNSATTRICISSENTDPSFNRTQFTTSVFATGDPTPFLASQQYNRNIGELGNPNNSPSVTYLQRFVSPTANRTINSIGISTSASLITNSTNSTVSSLRTYIKLLTPIVQTTTQVLDITYKVSIDWGTTIINNNNLYSIWALTQSFLGVAISIPQLAYEAQMGFNKVETGYLNNNNISGFSMIDASSSSPSSTSTSYLVSTTNLNSPTELIIGNYYAGTNFISTSSGTNSLQNLGCNFIGRFVHAVLVGMTKPVPNYAMHLGYKTKQVFSKTSNLSAITSHSINSLLVTYDANELANSSWQPSVSDTLSPADFPSTYILRVNNPGGLGVGTYKIHKTGWGGWNRGQWRNPIADKFLCFDLCRKESTYVPALPPDDYNFYNYRWLYKWQSLIGSEQFVSYKRNKGFGIYELTDRNLNVIYTRTLNQINPNITKIFDIAVIKSLNLVYVATDVGLFNVNVINNTVITLSPDKCLAVCVGFSDSVFAIFNPTSGTGRLSGSIGANWQTALNMGTPSPAINWNNIWRIFIDKDSASYNIMIIEGVTPKGVITTLGTGIAPVYYYRWWNNSSGVLSTFTSSKTVTASTVVISDLYMFPTHNSIMCSGGVWIYPSEILPIRSNILNSLLFFSSDIIEDITLANRFITNVSNAYTNFTITTGTATTIGNAGGSLNITNFNLLSKAKIACSLFNSSILASIQTNAGGLGDFIKPKLNTDTNVFNLIFTMSDHYTTLGNDIPDVLNTDPVKYSNGTIVNPSTTITTNGSYTLPTRLTLFYAINIDLTSTPIATIINYPETGPTGVHMYDIEINRAQQFGNLICTHDKRIIIADMQTAVPGAGFRMFSPIRNPTVDLTTELCETWSWNGTNWVLDPNNTAPGKPLHTSTDSLVDGLTINWLDLQPGNSKPLIAGQYYTLNRCTAPNQVPFDSHTPSPAFSTIVSPRNKSTLITDTFTNINSTGNIYLSKSTLGTSPDSNFWGTSAAYPGIYLILTATLNGVAVVVGASNTTPSAGTINIHLTTFRVLSNAGDNGKTLVLNYEYLLKLDPSEIPGI